ncbi:MAG: DUF3035 domain-containing protein [Paracoccus sp. (in: a-proteobacteria)]|nr:DUF3035 domain-containing protein [Paracoccus sp. (in: a-proteobacteria)]
MRAIIAMISAAGLLGACSGDPQLMNIRAGQTTPDEFAIVPTRPLTMPADLNQLPPPTPGGANITDPTPRGDAVAALGGNPGALVDQGIGAADQALVNHAARAGSQPGIRQQLAQEDADWRARHGRRPLETLARTNVYLRAYEVMTLDSEAELRRWRRAGAQTPSAPPRPTR